MSGSRQHVSNKMSSLACGHCEALQDLQKACVSPVDADILDAMNIDWHCDHCRALEELYNSVPGAPTDSLTMEEKIRLLNAELAKKRILVARLQRVIRVLLGPRY
jgi:hypothetical protein